MCAAPQQAAPHQRHLLALASAPQVNCAFYNKIGACRHGDRCQRLHNKPLFSLTVCLKGMYVNPINKIYGDSQRAIRRLTRQEESEIQASFEDFYIDVFDEAAKYGEVEDLFVCDNLGDHLIGEWRARVRGWASLHHASVPLSHLLAHHPSPTSSGNVYVKYTQEEEAADALKAMHGRWYKGSAVQAEYSPVTEFREARCRQFDEQGCARGPWCNFMHLKGIP